MLPGGSIFRSVETSKPIFVDGKTKTALSLWHDFYGDLRGQGDLERRTKSASKGSESQPGIATSHRRSDDDPTLDYPEGETKGHGCTGSTIGRRGGCRDHHRDRLLGPVRSSRSAVIAQGPREAPGRSEAGGWTAGVRSRRSPRYRGDLVHRPNRVAVGTPGPRARQCRTVQPPSRIPTTGFSGTRTKIRS